MKQKIPKIIEQGENEKVELKESFNKETIEAVVAFANAKGGIVLIGVSNNGAIKGISVGKETLKKWVNEISQAIEPTLIPEIENYKIRV